MKMTEEHYKYFKNEISKLNRQQCLALFDTLKSNPKVKNIQTAFSFNLMYAANLGNFVCKTLYQYLNDTHIETALKRITQELFPELFPK